jgi:prepilin-type N-terminal cleavage/methylation domain-containing protein
MIPRRPWTKRNTQRGFTIIEMAVALTITGLIAAGALMATMQIATQGTRNSTYTTASRHAQNAIQWISRDAQMSQVITLNGASGFPLDLNWVEWDNSNHQVVYTIADEELRRSYYVKPTGQEDWQLYNETLIAQYINSLPANTSCNITSDNTLLVKITATAGIGPRSISITKEREVLPRPGL